MTREEAEGRGNDHAWKPLPSLPPAPGWCHLSGGQFVSCFSLSWVVVCCLGYMGLAVIWSCHAPNPPYSQVWVGSNRGAQSGCTAGRAPKGPPAGGAASCREALQTQAVFRPLARGKKSFFSSCKPQLAHGGCLLHLNAAICRAHRPSRRAQPQGCCHLHTGGSSSQASRGVPAPLVPAPLGASTPHEASCGGTSKQTPCGFPSFASGKCFTDTCLKASKPKVCDE